MTNRNELGKQQGTGDLGTRSPERYWRVEGGAFRFHSVSVPKALKLRVAAAACTRSSSVSVSLTSNWVRFIVALPAMAVS